MSICVRGERPGDEDAIDLVNCEAFGSMNEANIVRGMRAYYPAFDRRYSVTAWDGGECVGHALFTPARLRLGGETVTALAVGPVAVRPDWQRQGIGGRLLESGNDLGRREGFAFSFLYGHPSYYPRYGYRPCFGSAKIIVDTEKLPEPSRRFRRRPVRPDDIPWLVARSSVEWEEVDFAWLRGTVLTEWTAPIVNALMWWTEDEERAAYTMRGAGPGVLIVAEEPALAQDVIATLKPSEMGHHPNGWLARNAVDPQWATCEAQRSDAAMACELQAGALSDYIAAVESGSRLPGYGAWPLPFVACP